MLCCIVSEVWGCGVLGYQQDDGMAGRSARERDSERSKGRKIREGSVCGFAAGCSRVERWVSVTAAFYLCYRFGFGF